MARVSYLLRRGANYYARLKVPTDLAGIVGKQELVKALGTKDENEAKRLMWPVVDNWNRHFDDLRSRREITADDKAEAVWRHYEATLQRSHRPIERGSLRLRISWDSSCAGLVMR